MQSYTSGRRSSLIVLGFACVASIGPAEAALAAAGAPSLADVRLAYLDPGSGSFVVQALIAMFAGIIVTGRMYWSKIKGFFGLGGDPDDDEDEDVSSGDV